MTFTALESDGPDYWMVDIGGDSIGGAIVRASGAHPGHSAIRSGPGSVCSRSDAASARGALRPMSCSTTWMHSSAR